MICPNCGSDIPSEFRFCGMCGRVMPRPAKETAKPEAESTSAARHEPERATPWDTAAPPKPAEPELGEPPISGPSFLGLGGSVESHESYTYLLDDEPRRHTGVFVLALVLVILAGVAAVKRDAIRRYVATMYKPAATSAPKSVAPTDPALASTTTPPEPQPQPVPLATPGDQPQMVVQNPSPQPEPKQAPAATAPAAPASAPAATEPAASAQEEAKAPAEVKETKAVTAKPKDERGARTLALGEKYLYGRGVVRNCSQALVYLKAAALEGNAQARSHLGALYSTGECVSRDRVAAYHWFTLAKQAEPTNPWLESNLNMLWRDMSSAERQRVGAER